MAKELNEGYRFDSPKPYYHQADQVWHRKMNEDHYWAVYHARVNRIFFLLLNVLLIIMVGFMWNDFSHVTTKELAIGSGIYIITCILMSSFLAISFFLVKEIAYPLITGLWRWVTAQDV